MLGAIPLVYQNKSLSWGEFAGPEPLLTGAKESIPIDRDIYETVQTHLRQL